jgi:hypothetical protein
VNTPDLFADEPPALHDETIDSSLETRIRQVAHRYGWTVETQIRLEGEIRALFGLPAKGKK